MGAGLPLWGLVGFFLAGTRERTDPREDRLAERPQRAPRPAGGRQPERPPRAPPGALPRLFDRAGGGGRTRTKPAGGDTGGNKPTARGVGRGIAGKRGYQAAAAETEHSGGKRAWAQIRRKGSDWKNPTRPSSPSPRPSCGSGTETNSITNRGPSDALPSSSRRWCIIDRRRAGGALGRQPAAEGVRTKRSGRHSIVTSAALVGVLVAEITLTVASIGVGHRLRRAPPEAICYGSLTIPLQFARFLTFGRRFA